jgi:hypothetical protein
VENGGTAHEVLQTGRPQFGEVDMRIRAAFPKIKVTAFRGPPKMLMVQLTHTQIDEKRPHRIKGIKYERKSIALTNLMAEPFLRSYQSLM